MRRRFFLKNLALFLVPTVIPVLVLSIATTAIIFRFLRAESLSANQNRLDHMVATVESAFQVVDRISIDMGSNSNLTSSLRAIFSEAKPTYSSYNYIKYVRSYINTQSSSNPAVASVYLYLDNPARRFIGPYGAVCDLDTHADTQWYAYYQEKTAAVPGAQPLFQNDLDANEGLLMVYQDVYYPGRIKPIGVIAVNFYKQHFRQLLNGVNTSEGEMLVITDSDNVLIANNANFDQTDVCDAASRDGVFLPDMVGGAYIVSSVESERFAWKYYSITPKSTVYRLPNVLVFFELTLLLCSLCIGILLAIHMTRRYQKSVLGVIDILERAEKDQIGEIGQPRNDFDYIIRNILNIYIRQNQMSRQLSEKKHRLQLMELVALQSQISPHFLHNALQTIYLRTLALPDEFSPICRMIENLMVIMRYSLSDPTRNVKLEEELRNVRAYIALEQYQYGSRLAVLWEVDEQTCGVEVPKMLIQPLVENCIRHAFRQDGAQLKIKLRVCREDNAVRICIIDNGSGIAREKLCEIQQACRSAAEIDDVAKNIGLMSTIKRLKLVYGDKVEIVVRSRENFGTSVAFKINL